MKKKIFLNLKFHQNNVNVQNLCLLHQKLCVGRDRLDKHCFIKTKKNLYPSLDVRVVKKMGQT